MTPTPESSDARFKAFWTTRKELLEDIEIWHAEHEVSSAWREQKNHYQPIVQRLESCYMKLLTSYKKQEAENAKLKEELKKATAQGQCALRIGGGETIPEYKERIKSL